MASATSRAAAALETGPSDPGSTGTPTRATIRRASVFCPIVRRTSGGGPTNVRPAVRQASAKRQFSDRNPYPGWTASAPASRAAPTTRSIER